MLRAAVDTNIFISGLLGSFVNRTIINALKESEFELVISRLLLEEIWLVAERPKFHNLIAKEQVNELIGTITDQALFVKPTKIPEIVFDPADNELLASALEAKADFIVTGDKELLSFKSFHSIPIIVPKEFVERLKK